MKKAFLILSFVLITFYGCGSSTGSRYEKDEEDKKEEIRTEDKSAEEKTSKEVVFDMTPYKSEFNFNIRPEVSDEKLWYGYEDTLSASNDEQETQLTYKPGYRVEVTSTDNLEEANTVKSELTAKVKSNIYVIFDPPFYRVRIGDYENRNSAENQSFRLRQLGFQDSRVVSDSIRFAGGQ